LNDQRHRLLRHATDSAKSGMVASWGTNPLRGGILVLGTDDADTIRDAATLSGQLATTLALAVPMLAELREALLRIAPDTPEAPGEVDQSGAHTVER
jgi:hypothetical protein